VALDFALWGFFGALVYASTRLVTQLFAGEDAPTRRRRTRALAQFATAVMAGPILAAGFTTTVVGWLHGLAQGEAVALTLGLSCNTLWPILVDGLGRRGRIISGDIEP
jgi:hypothetical protein